MIEQIKNFFKKNTKEPDITFWSVIDEIENISPFTKSIDNIPDWFKKLKKDGSIKKCPGLIDYFRLGYIHYLWCDVIIDITEKGFDWKTPDTKFNIGHHSREQYLDYIPSNEYKYIVKPISPWRCKTKKNLSIIQLPLYYHFNELFDVMPGIINTDYYHQIHPQLAFKKTGTFFLSRGTPLCMIIPFERNKIEMVVRKNDEETKKWENLARLEIQTKFSGHYKKINKCPFHR